MSCPKSLCNHGSRARQLSLRFVDSDVDWTSPRMKTIRYLSVWFLALACIALAYMYWKKRAAVAELDADLNRLSHAAPMHANEPARVSPGPGVARQSGPESGFSPRTDTVDIRAGGPLNRADNPADVTFRMSHGQAVYGNLVESLSLPVAAQTALKKLLIERQAILDDVVLLCRREGVTDANTIAQAQASAIADVTKRIAESLDEPTGQRLSELLKLAPANAIIQYDFAPDMDFANVPMGKGEALALAVVMHEIGYSPDRPDFDQRMREPPDPVTGLNPLCTELVNRASAFLSPAQLDVLRKTHRP